MNEYEIEDLKKIKGSFQSKSNKLNNVLDGSEYLRFVNVITRNWNDNEAEKFLLKLEESINICKEEIKRYNNKVQSLVDLKIK